MSERIEKPKVNRAKYPSDLISQKKKNGGQVTGILDNRPGSNIALQGKMNLHKAVQLIKITKGKTSIENKGQAFNYGKGSVTVGKEMEAYLDPASPIRGWSANLNKSQDNMMSAIRKYHKITGGDLVKGHLLNDNLGGTALGENLYPITRGANSSHLGFVENLAKDYAWNGAGLHYIVKVEGKPSITETSSNFLTSISTWDPNTDKEGKSTDINVESNLKDVKDYDAAYDPEDFNKKLSRENNPKKPKHFEEPAKNVSDLNKWEAEARSKDS